MTFYDEDESPIESHEEHVERFGVDDDPAEEEAARVTFEEPGEEVARFAPGVVPIVEHEQRLHALEEHVARLSDRLERLEADLGVDDEFGDRPLPLDTPDIATVRREPGNEPRHEPFEQAQDREDARALAARGEAALAEPESLDEINRRARAEAEALREQDLAVGQGLTGVPEMVPAPLDDDMTDKPGFR